MHNSILLLMLLYIIKLYSILSFHILGSCLKYELQCERSSFKPNVLCPYESSVTIFPSSFFRTPFFARVLGYRIFYRFYLFIVKQYSSGLFIPAFLYFRKTFKILRYEFQRQYN